MNSLTIINNRADQTPIEVMLQVGDDNRVSSKSVYEFLGGLPNHYARWCRGNIEDNQFAEEGVDFTPSPLMVNGNLTIDYRLSVPFAKKLCMLSKTERGEQARDYFIKVEDALKKIARTIPQLTTNELVLKMAQANVELEKQIGAVQQEVHEISGKFDAALKTFAAPSIDHWRADMDAKIKSIAETHGKSPLKLRGIMYAELEQVATVDVSIRLTRLRGRMKKQGATYKERQAVTMLDVISKDKQLRVIFEGIVKKYQAVYEAQA